MPVAVAGAVRDMRREPCRRRGRIERTVQRRPEGLDDLARAARLRREPHDVHTEPLHLTEFRDQYLSAAKARRLLGWKPTYGLEAGLGETIAWYRGFLGRAAA